MPEKTLVTIDCDLVIPEDKEKVFENQHIRLEAGIQCNGKLIFRNCTIEPCTSVNSETERKGRRSACEPGRIDIGNNSHLEMDECEVIHPTRGFLSGFGDLAIKNTSFLDIPCSDNAVFTKAFLTQCVIAAHGDKKFVGCSFIGETENNSQTSELALINDETAIMDSCTFKNITGGTEVNTISNCSFTGCTFIEGVEIIGSTFTDCKKINARSGNCRNCDFIHIEDLAALSSNVDSCRFQNIKYDAEDEGVIFIEDSKMINCIFDGVDLRNNSYLIYGAGDACVTDCQFLNCHTDREDSELCCVNQADTGSAYAEVKSKPAFGLLKGALKLAGSAALGAVGVAATVAREAGNLTGSELLSDLAGTVQDASFETVRDMWGMDGTRKIDSMSMDELMIYLDKLEGDMNEEDRASFWDMIHSQTDSLNKDEMGDEEYLAQLKEIVKGVVRDTKKFERATKRADSASRNAEQFRKRYEKEKAKYENKG